MKYPISRHFFSTIAFCSIFFVNAFASSNSENRENLCDLLNEELVIAAFDLPADITFDKTDSDIICSYGWTNEDTGAFYSVSLNFARGGQRDDASARAVWESQNERLYNDKDMQEITGVGDLATWSTLGGGQLRILFDGYIFYVSFMQYPSNSMGTSEMIEKSSTIANTIIDKL